MSETLPAINERIKTIVAHYANGVVSAFADMLEGVSQQKLNRIFNKDTRTDKYPMPTTDILVAITEKFVELNTTWLLTGYGEMLISAAKFAFTGSHHGTTSAYSPIVIGDKHILSEPKTVYNDPPTFANSDPPTDPPKRILIPQYITVDNTGKENILHVNAKAAAGYLNGYGDREYIEQLPSFSLPGLVDGTFRSFEVEGDSMHPTLKSGQMVIGKWVEKLDYIRDDRVYIVIHKTRGIVIKRLLNRIEQRNVIVAKSDATNDRQLYKSYDIAPDDVQELWYAVFYGGFDFQSPSDMWKRLNNVEADLTAVMQLLKNNNITPQ